MNDFLIGSTVPAAVYVGSAEIQKIYQGANLVWQSFDGILYNGTNATAYNDLWVIGYGANDPTVIYKAVDHLYADLTGTEYVAATWVTGDTYNLTNYSNLKVNGLVSRGGKDDLLVYVVVDDVQGDPETSYEAQIVYTPPSNALVDEPIELNLDISSITSSLYIRVHLSDTKSGNTLMKITNVTLEQ
jgi:hypothetical protein